MQADTRDGLELMHPNTAVVLSELPAADPAVLRVTRGERGAVEDVDETDTRTLVGFAPVAGLPWGVLVHFARGDVFAQVDAMIVDSTMLALLVLLMAGVVGLFAARRMVRPLRELQHAALDVASGKLDRRSGI